MNKVFHPVILFGITLLAFLFIWFSKQPIYVLLMACGTLFFYTFAGLTLRTIGMALLIIVPLISLLLLTNMLFGQENLRELFPSLQRLFWLFIVSICSAHLVDYEKLLLYCMSRKWLSVMIGYPMLIAINSVSLLKEEVQRIKISFRFKGVPMYKKLFVLFPLLVFAIRHSQRGAIALVTRGLNKDKNFYFSYDILTRDRRLLLSFCLFYGLIVLISLL